MKYKGNEFEDFLEDTYNAKILENSRKGKLYLNIDFQKIVNYDPDLASKLLDEPKEMLEILEICLTKISDNKKNMQAGLFNLPETEERYINRIRKEDIDKLIVLNGILVSRDKVRPRYKQIIYACPSCGNQLIVKQTKINLIEPTICGCGKKGKFKVIDKQFENLLSIKLEEPTENLIGSETPYNLTVELKDESIKGDHNLYLGSRIRVVGILKEQEISKNGRTLNVCDYKLECISYRSQDFNESLTEVTEEEKNLFEDISKCPNPAKLISKFLFSDIYGLTKAKELCIYQQFSGGMWSGKRDFIHILLFGHPGTAKTDIATRVAAINPISKIATGSHLSGVGLTAAIIKDELTGQFVAKGGVLARANGGLAVIDEIEKMTDYDKKSLHTPMESGQFSVDKAGISAKVVSKTSILATANPNKCFETPKVVSNLDLPSAIIDRFDFILINSDIPAPTSDGKIAVNIINRAICNGNPTTLTNNNTTFNHIDTTYYIVSLCKYIYKAKKINPNLSRRVVSLVKDWYVQVRQASTGIGYIHKKPTPRAVESILRLARAISRSKLKDTVTLHELKLAIEYNEYLYGSDTLPGVIEEKVEE